VDTTDEPAPSAALDSTGGSIEFFLEPVQISIRAIDFFFQRSVTELAASSISRCEICPKQRVIDVT
jgi:hypothetical protein